MRLVLVNAMTMKMGGWIKKKLGFPLPKMFFCDRIEQADAKKEVEVWQSDKF